MSDTPTTAEEVIAQAIVATVEARRRGRSHLTAEFEAGAIVAALRSSPEALADLNGGEWVQIVDPGTPFTMWVDSEGGTWWTKDDDPPRPDWTPAYRFVPREAQQ